MSLTVKPRPGRNVRKNGIDHARDIDDGEETTAKKNRGEGDTLSKHTHERMLTVIHFIM